MIKRGFCFLILLTGLAACSSRMPDPRPYDLDGIKNSVQVNRLFFGSQPSQDALAELKKRGFRTILSTRGEGELEWDEKKAVEELGMAFVNIPMDKPVMEITDEQVARFANLMEVGERPLMLHCGSGNRVAGLWAVWLVEYEGMEPREALQLAEKAGMTRIRPIVEKRLASHEGRN